MSLEKPPQGFHNIVIVTRIEVFALEELLEFLEMGQQQWQFPGAVSHLPLEKHA
jgi:hypothetical protein